MRSLALFSDRCPLCDSSDVRRSHRRNAWERLLYWMGIKPMRCRDCYNRFFMF
jgi:hypothetical protein